MKNLYSKRPSDDLILRGMQALGFSGWNSSGFVEEASLDHTLMLEVVDELRSCFFPSYGKKYLDKEEFKYYDFIVLVRQMLRLKGRKLPRRERLLAVAPKTYKTISFYSLSEDTNTTQPATVTFD
jgi:hypothetical protein